MCKCIICGNELLTGDIHWEQGLCNQCYNFKSLSNRREEYIQSLKQQLAEKDKKIANIRHQVCEEIRENAQQKRIYRETSGSTSIAVAAGILKPEGVEYIILYTIPESVLNQIEQGEE